MSDKFIKGLQRALVRKKQQAAANPITSTSRTSAGAKPFARFDEILYQSTIISKMITLITKRKEQSK